MPPKDRKKKSHTDQRINMNLGPSNTYTPKNRKPKTDQRVRFELVGQDNPVMVSADDIDYERGDYSDLKQFLKQSLSKRNGTIDIDKNGTLIVLRVEHVSSCVYPYTGNV